MISIAHPDSLFLAGSGGACLKRRIRTWLLLCVHCSASATFFLRGCPSPIVSAPSLFVLVGPHVADASVMNEQERVCFEINESKLWMAGLQRTVLDCRSLVSLCFSSSTFWKGRCSCFDSFNSHVVSVFLLFSVYSETLSRELRDEDV